MQQIILEETFCTLCLNTIRDSNCQMIDVIKDVLKILLPDLNLEETVKHFMCTVCSGKLFAAFNFKARCTHTEDIIFPYISASRTSTVDLKEIYLKENGNNQIINILEDHRICRLCFQLVTDEFAALKEVDGGIIDMYIPQVNISATRDPVICRACFDSLHTHSSFLRNCLDTWEKYNYVDEPFYVKIEEIEIKLEDNGRDPQEKYGCDDNQSKEIEIKLKDDEKGGSSPDDLGNETIEYKKMHHSQDIEQIKGKYIHKCEIGSKEHRNVPIPKRKTSRFTMCERFYRCDKCKYKSRFKTNLKRHQLVHGKPSECSFKTKYKNGLEKHKLLHNNPSEMQMYKCDTCSFETKHKRNLKRHQLKHKDPSEIQIYKCDRCSFETKHKGNLKRHQIKHKDPPKIQMYKCDTCSYETKRKDHLKLHQLRHKNPSEIHMYECDTCSFRTKRKDDLKRHQLRHKNPSDTQM
ncbi:putative uncharacterized zinc finger protein 814 [Anoplophora glabripennis]|uniref:putative uncharacterized zinc finger protein 814 n=1 Tax=Anoplophora glabripennis TaxID=217634 RepID=UPI000C77705C|nr:putative uncharacterized zinc finger protein 814 [Anoplophora glabripennis]